MAASLSQLCKDCEASFVDLKRSLDEYLQDHEESRPCVLDQYERFQIWAGNIGAKQESTIKTSLDWRVREAPKIQYQIGELLGDLCSAIEELDSIISGKRPNRTASPLSTNEEACTEEHGLSEIDELVRMLSESITDLFKISLLIQRATPRDRFLKAQSSNKQPLDPYHDISHVSHKFPMLAEDDKQWLSYKLGLANTQRRQFFRYVRQHREMKAVVPENPVSAVPEIDTNGLTDPNAIGVDLPETRTVVSSQRPASSFAQTTASTLAMAKLQPVHQEIDDEDLMSHMSFATSVNESSNSERLRVPNLEDIAHGQLDFECPYCYKIVRPRSHNQWK